MNKITTQSKLIPSLILIGGKSGIGKSSIINKLISLSNQRYSRPMSYTTRGRREGENEYEYNFIPNEEFEQLKSQGQFVTADKVYGNYYAMTKSSIDTLISNGIIPIKEIHPSNFSKIKQVFPDAITVIIDGNAPNNNAERNNADEEFYATIDVSNYDIVIKNDFPKSIEYIAKQLDNLIKVIISTKSIFPLPSIIDSVNRIGYNKIASEFTEEKRITTKNFHTASIQFFNMAITNHIKASDKILETGPGQNWLLNNFSIPAEHYSSIDVAINMSDKSWAKTVGSIRNTPFEDNSFDIVISSLADSYFYPSAICEINRILKPQGKFIFTTPSSVWSNAIHRKDTNKTEFVLQNGEMAEVFSFTFSMDEVIDIITMCGFKTIFAEEITPTFGQSEIISQAIVSAAQNTNKQIKDIIILNAIICEKEDKNEKLI
jgi:guanylate kinase